MEGHQALGLIWVATSTSSESLFSTAGFHNCMKPENANAIEDMQQLRNTEGQKVDGEQFALHTCIKTGKRFDIDPLHDVTP